MEHEALSPLTLFLQAGPVAKFVILLLVAASIWCWVLIVEGIWSVVRLKNAILAARGQKPARRAALLAPIAEAGRQAAALHIPGESVTEARTRVTEAMNRAARTLLTRIEGGLPNLAVISSVAPSFTTRFSASRTPCVSAWTVIAPAGNAIRRPPSSSAVAVTPGRQEIQ